LEQNPDKISWRNLSVNPKAIHILEQNLDKIDWVYLSGNPEAIHLISKALEQNPDKINWFNLSMNPAIFTYDYKKMREHIEQSGIKDELISVYYNPKNIKHFLDRGDVHEGFESRWV
jgi:ADP-dependent phosphofructokinase/glucokinase